MSEEQLFTLRVNGRECRIRARPSTSLMRVLRDTLRLTGVKDGCSTGHCGTCTVIVNGKAVRSCLVPMQRADWAEILTIEGLAEPGGQLHPIQQAFIDQGATQCGFCTPGLVMAVKALLDRVPNPTRDQIQEALKWNLCRCTGYNAILRAIQQVMGEAVPPPPAVGEPLKAIGRPLPRPDAVTKVTGKAVYADDLYVEGMLHARALRSNYPHARILRIDVRKARTLPGVAAVLTAQDIPGRKNFGIHELDWPVLCRDKVRYVGDALALVAAESEDVAARALELIEVEYEPLAVVGDPKQGADPQAPVIHEDLKRYAPEGSGNCLAHFHLANGDPEVAFPLADAVVEREYVTQSVEHGFLEPEAGLAVPEATGRITVYSGGQIPFHDRALIAASLDCPEENVRVVNCMVGGAFGGKEDVSVQIHVALLAQATGRPVKMVFSREESLRVHPKRHATIIRMKTAARRDGTLVAHKAEIYGDGGAYASLSNQVMLRCTTHAAGPYEVPNAQVDTYVMYTNNVPSGAFRGFGVTQCTFAMESQMDILAQELGLSPLEIRRKNVLRLGKKTLAGQILTESCGMPEALEAVATEMARHPFVAAEGDKRRAWGLACAYKNTGFGSGALDAAGAEVEMLADGRVIVRAGASEIGQGLTGVLAQVATEELGVPYDRVEVLVADTDLTPDGMATTASRQTYVTGNAARAACREVRGILDQVAAEMLEAPPGKLAFADGQVSGAGRQIPLDQVAMGALREGRILKARCQYVAPPTLPYQHFAFGFGAQAALVEVDVRTGKTKVLQVIAACDAGRVINPLALQGQVEGSISMGLGMALQEAFVMRDGYVVSDSLHECHLPTIDQTPEVICLFVEEKAREGPYGAKGVGELASIPTVPAIINAIAAATGIRCLRLPASTKWLKAALEEKGKEAPSADHTPGKTLLGGS